MKHRRALVLLFAAGVLAGCQGKQDAAVVEPGARTEVTEHEIAGTHDQDDLDPITAQRWIDSVRLGRHLGPEGQVSDEAQADTFGAQETIHLSMVVADTPGGSKVRVSVYDADRKSRVWSEEKTVIAGQPTLSFTIDAGKLARGNYRAEVIVGDETVADRPFEVTDHHA